MQLLPGNAGRLQVAEALANLRAAKRLAGFRGSPPADSEAVIEVVLAIGRLMQGLPELIEIDVNPLTVLPEGQGAVALDALMVAGSARG